MSNKNSAIRTKPQKRKITHYNRIINCDDHQKCKQNATPVVSVYYLLPPTLGQVLLGSQRADGADPRLSHAFDPQHHPAELLPL